MKSIEETLGEIERRRDKFQVELDDLALRSHPSQNTWVARMLVLELRSLKEWILEG